MEEILNALSGDIQLLLTKLADVHECEMSGPDDLIYIYDPEKEYMQERIKILEEQQRELTENYRNTHASMMKLRTDIYKFKQKVKYKVNSQETAAKASRTDYELPLPVEASPEQMIEILKERIEKQNKRKQDLQDKIVQCELKVEREKMIKGIQSAEVEMNRVNSFSKLNQNKEDQNLYSSTQSQKPEIDLSLEKKGFLLKRGGKNLSKWQKRFFELSYSKDNKMYVLSYKQKEDKGPIKGQIPLAWCSFQTSLVEYKKGVKTEASFSVIPRMTEKKKKNYYLCASSIEEMKEWIAVLEKAATVHPPAEDLLSVAFKINDTLK